MRTAINVYSVRELDATLSEVIERVADAGYDGIQFSGRFSPLGAERGEIERVHALLEKTDLTPTAPHVGIDFIDGEWEVVNASFDPLGVDGVVVPSIHAEHFETAAAVDGLAERFDAVASRLDERGWTFHYHNHDFEYQPLNGTSGFERFIDRSNISIELDVGWAAVGGDDPAERIRSLGDRIDLVHMKDVNDAGEPCEIGDGIVDMEACADAAREVDASWLIYEHDTPTDPAASIDHGAAFLNGL